MELWLLLLLLMVVLLLLLLLRPLRLRHDDVLPRSHELLGPTGRRLPRADHAHRVPDADALIRGHHASRSIPHATGGEHHHARSARGRLLGVSPPT